MPRIVITDYEFETIDHEQSVAHANGIELERAYCTTEEDVLKYASEADGIIVQYAPITERVLKGLPRLKAISRYGVGVDNIDVEAATQCGIAVSNVPDYGVEDVSDHAIALALTLGRGIPDLDRGIRSGQNLLNSVKPLRRFSSQTFGVVGLGLIGAATAAKAKSIGYRVLGYDPLHAPGTTTKEGVPVVSFEDLLAESDVVSLHVPLNSHTHRLINPHSLGQFKEGATLINTCRGGVVDTEALVDALKIGRIRAAGLDVFEEEPLPLNSALLDLDRVVLTPHSAWYTEESNDELKRRTAENVVEACLGRRPRNILNPEVLS
ncbi:D-3-phosphoglycerate dehydrogenase [Pseudarthrobacter siccitolerans]|uniref:D-3-phosphoglycerate dehydrogenase n=1 Tax=Pseudarthrobacter siccitolerans TaxID=861266 RepID=A0ABU0PLZ3_9MICC|nr:C-terminal binding protein [Pseudarthrobacter siccitolerans]MDQ0674986.1 D-3-phosphoglycerate dehydrogenase [Pseudarthrobacter siccitolerans]